MRLFDQVSRALSGALGGGGGDSSSALIGHLLEAFGQSGQKEGDQKAGLAGLVQAFQANGLGKVVESWISTGENLPVSHGQISQVLGQGMIQRLSQATGMSPDALSAKLSEVLPTAVDKLTPGGKIPEGGMLAQVLDMLKSKPS